MSLTTEQFERREQVVPEYHGEFDGGYIAPEPEEPAGPTKGERIASAFESELSEAMRSLLSRLIDREHAAMRLLLTDILNEFHDRYDGCPDSTTLWMGTLIERIERVTATD